MFDTKGHEGTCSRSGGWCVTESGFGCPYCKVPTSAQWSSKTVQPFWGFGLPSPAGTSLALSHYDEGFMVTLVSSQGCFSSPETLGAVRV